MSINDFIDISDDAIEAYRMGYAKGREDMWKAKDTSATVEQLRASFDAGYRKGMEAMRRVYMGSIE